MGSECSHSASRVQSDSGASMLEADLEREQSVSAPFDLASMLYPFPDLS